MDHLRTSDATPDAARELRRLHAQLDELSETNTALRAELAAAQRELAQTRSGLSWRFLTGWRRFRLVAMPLGTRRDRAVRRILAGLDGSLRLGPLKTLRILLLRPRHLKTALRAARSDGLFLNQQYRQWLERHKMTSERAALIDADIRRFAYRPLISVLMPVFNTDARWLQAAVNSVRQQLYPCWELCVVDDASTAPHIGPLLRSLAAEDSRIKLKTLDANEGISGASNHALALATGEFVGLLDHDDTLEPDALYEVARRLDPDGSIDLFYTDHDMRDEYNRRKNPFFKPDWSPDLLLSMNYITHFAVYRRRLVVSVGGFRKGFEGAQDFDLLLRATEQASRIAHVPLPLYSWGQAPASVATNPGAKPYAHEAGRRALEDAIFRRGIAGEVVDGEGAPYRYRVKRSIIGRPLVSILIPTRDNGRLLERCVRSLESRTAYQPFEILVIDNQSTDPETVAYLGRLSHRVLKFEEPFNFARMNNAAAAAARGEHVLFLNDDTEVITAGWLDAMLEHSQRPEVGAVGARLLFPNKTIQHAGVVIGIHGKAGHAFWGFPGDHPGYWDFARVIRNYSAVTAACLMMRRALFEEMSGFDEAFAISYNDVDLCLRLRARGYLIVYTPYATLYHHQSASRGAYDPLKDRKYEELLQTRWKHIFENGDPSYNPNLTLASFDFSLRL
jgi:GT2 family glycosyltransferase